MVAHQRRQRLVDRPGTAHQHHGAQPHQGQTLAQRTQQCRRGHPDTPQQHQGQHTEQQHVQHKTPGSEFARLGHVGDEDVAHHRRVEHHAIGADEVGAGRSGNRQQGQQRPDGPARGQRRHDEGVQCCQGDHVHGREEPGAGFRRAAAVQAQVDVLAVGHQHPKQSGQQHQLVDAQGQVQLVWFFRRTVAHSRSFEHRRQ
jgi:hypothetical protein